MRTLAVSTILGSLSLLLQLTSYAQLKPNLPAFEGCHFKHVLLISLDGLHALDLSNYVAIHPGSTLAALSAHEVTFTNAASSEPSDSFPRPGVSGHRRLADHERPLV